MKHHVIMRRHLLNFFKQQFRVLPAKPSDGLPADTCRHLVNMCHTAAYRATFYKPVTKNGQPGRLGV